MYLYEYLEHCDNKLVTKNYHATEVNILSTEGVFYPRDKNTTQENFRANYLLCKWDWDCRSGLRDSVRTPFPRNWPKKREQIWLKDYEVSHSIRQIFTAPFTEYKMGTYDDKMVACAFTKSFS